MRKHWTGIFLFITSAVGVFAQGDPCSLKTPPTRQKALKEDSAAAPRMNRGRFRESRFKQAVMGRLFLQITTVQGEHLY